MSIARSVYTAGRATITFITLSLACRSALAQPLHITVTTADAIPGTSGKTALVAMSTNQGKRPAVIGAQEPQFGVVSGTIPPVVYTADIFNHGGITLHDATFHDVFVNPVALGNNSYGQSLSGPTINDADAFLADLFLSSMIHVLDQYTATPISNRRVGQQGVISYQPRQTTIHETDLQTLVHAAGRSLGSGAGHVLNLFSAEGVVVCSTFGSGTTEYCETPDQPATSIFCAFHNYYDFPDIGRVYFTMQPFANPEFCQELNAPDAHGLAIDSMANLLSHEVLETISDPNQDAWYSNRFGSEISDLCAWIAIKDAPMLQTSYRIQGVYNNQVHACVWAYPSF